MDSFQWKKKKKKKKNLSFHGIQLLDVSHEMLFFFFEIMFFEKKKKKIQCLIFSENYKKIVVYCNLMFKVSHLALDNMNLISINGRR